MLVAGKDRARITFEETDHFPIPPTPIVFDQRIGDFIVRKRNQRLNAVFLHFVEQAIVKCQPCLIRCFFIAIGEDTRPSNRRSQAFEPHFGKQGDILWIAMVKIDSNIFDAFTVARCPFNDRAKNPLLLQI
ncbi:Uncharacterised protein [Yersinia enterocolitica]|nr:Uncharacterised protein [Yersinia enterocolitica]